MVLCPSYVYLDPWVIVGGLVGRGLDDGIGLADNVCYCSYY